MVAAGAGLPSSTVIACKSLTLKMIAGIEVCDRGSLRLDGCDIASLEPAGARIAYVPQKLRTGFHLTPCRSTWRFCRRQIRICRKYWIDRLGLRGLKTWQLEALSFGQQQRVASARAGAPVPWLLDEPFSALDAPLFARLRWEMLALAKGAQRCTTAISGHPRSGRGRPCSPIR